MASVVYKETIKSLKYLAAKVPDTKVIVLSAHSHLFVIRVSEIMGTSDWLFIYYQNVEIKFDTKTNLL